MEPSVLARSSQTTDKLLLLTLASWMVCQIIAQCSTHPGKPGIPAFWTEVSMYSFCSRNAANLLARIPNMILPSMSRRDIWMEHTDSYWILLLWYVYPFCFTPRVWHDIISPQYFQHLPQSMSDAAALFKILHMEHCLVLVKMLFLPS